MTRVILDVGAHECEKTYALAKDNPDDVVVYAFEPNLRVAGMMWHPHLMLPNLHMIAMAVGIFDGFAEFDVYPRSKVGSLLQLNPDTANDWRGIQYWRVEQQQSALVPVIRLDTALSELRLGEIEWLKIDAQGNDLDVIRSAGDRLQDIQRVTCEVAVKPSPYQGACSYYDVVTYMIARNFTLVDERQQSFEQELNLTFERL